MEPQEKPARGRPRSHGTRLAIYQAAVAICSERGFADMTIEGVAARAGVGKQTIYRWWPNLAFLLFDALTELAGKQVAPLDEEEAARVSPEDFIRRTFQVAKAHRSALSKMMALAQLDDESRKQLVARFIEPRRRIARAVFFAGKQPNARHELFLDQFFGLLWYGILVRDEALAPAAAKSMQAAYRAAAGA